MSCPDCRRWPASHGFLLPPSFFLPKRLPRFDSSCVQSSLSPCRAKLEPPHPPPHLSFQFGVGLFFLDRDTTRVSTLLFDRGRVLFCYVFFVAHPFSRPLWRLAFLGKIDWSLPFVLNRSARLLGWAPHLGSLGRLFHAPFDAPSRRSRWSRFFF